VESSHSSISEARGLDYFSAVQAGRARVKRSLETLQSVAGPSYPVLFLKMGTQDWTPVGEEEMFSVVAGKEGKAAVVVCDSEGNAKAMSSWVEKSDAERISVELEVKGLGRFEGEVKLPI
jgi:hypothetical protein